MGETTQMTPIVDIIVGDNIRHDIDGLKGLVASIERIGIVQPLIVQETENGKVSLIAGHRRLEAAILAGLHAVPTFEINEYEVDDRNRIEIQIAENIFREDLTPMEKAQAMLALSEAGATQREVAAAAGVTQKSAKGWLALGRSELTESGDIAEDALVELALEVDAEDIAPAVLEFLEPSEELRGGYRSLEDAYIETQRTAKRDASLAKATDIADRLEKKGLTVEWTDAYSQKGFEIVDTGDKKADEIANQTYGDKIVLDLKAHREEDCHLVVVKTDWEGARVTERCLKPKRHEKVGATVEVPNAKTITKAQDKKKADRKVEREQRAELIEEMADWLRDAKPSKADQLAIFQTSALKTLPHGWQDDICKWLELNVDADGTKHVKVKDATGDYERLQTAEERAVEAYEEKLNATALVAFKARLLVTFDVLGNRRYGFDSDLAGWYTEYVKA
jgi:ParB-like chromosome segregation protein Spo0J